ncbi:MAG: (Fe-S)-binding protein [Lactobacillus sp.]|jgi:Fe-S oxidoreductase|nr:(Fe-S)-binding protein [Lactobacillus sp.]
MKYGFMAGCSLSSASPKNVANIIAYLKHYYPDLAVIQACCGKPRRMIGQEAAFQKQFASLTDMVHEAGIDELLVACQGCLKTMTDQNQFKMGSLWVKMAELGLPKAYLNKAKDSQVVFSIQDSCPTKDRTDIHEAVRYLIHSLGYATKETRLSGKNTLCCGMGGMCGVSNPPLAKTAATKRVHDFKTDYIVTYCASCTAAMILGGGRSWHLLDLIFGDVVQLGDTCPDTALHHPLTAWANRYRSKQIVAKA